MRILACLSVVTFCFVAIACKKDDTSAPPTTAGQPPVAGQYPPGQYPAQGAPQGYPQQPGYATPPGAVAPQGYPQPGTPGAPAATPGAPAVGGTMATPGPLALPCQNDQACGLAHCNTQFQKCAFPCQSAVDCIQGASCNTMTGFCLPGGG